MDDKPDPSRIAAAIAISRLGFFGLIVGEEIVQAKFDVNATMARKVRIVYAGAFDHVINRGNDRSYLPRRVNLVVQWVQGYAGMKRQQNALIRITLCSRLETR